MTIPDAGSASATAASLYDLAPCGLITTAPDGTLTHVNDTFLAWTGYTADAVIGRRFLSLLDGGGKLFHETRYLPSLRLRGEVREIALNIVAADGTVLPALLNSTAEIDEHGSQVAVHSALFDTTERQDYERQLLAARRSAEASALRLRALQNASAAFGAARDDSELAAAIAASAADAFSAARVAVTLTDDAGRFERAAGDGPVAALASLIDDADTELADGEVLIVQRAEAPADVAAELERTRVETATVVGLVDGGTAIGMLSCFHARVRDVDAVQIELHQALARQASQALIRIRLQQELEAIAHFDPLTGLANRNVLRSHIADVMRRGGAAQQPMALVFLDLDGFKAINDEVDHSAGDDVLRAVADRLRASVRRADVVGRYGGDEFIVVCENTDETAAAAVAERIRAALTEPLASPLLPHGLTASIGAAVHLPSDPPQLVAIDVFRIADRAMYHSKRSGKDRVTVLTV